jgi:hypothetical protein
VRRRRVGIIAGGFFGTAIRCNRSEETRLELAKFVLDAGLNGVYDETRVTRERRGRRRFARRRRFSAGDRGRVSRFVA